MLPTDPLLAGFASSALFGAVNSLHCAGMCGPLVIAVAGMPGTGLAYHAARLASYGVLGALLGGLGGHVLPTSAHTGAWLGFVLAASLLLFALGLDRFLHRVPGLATAARHASDVALRLPPAARAGALGAITPLLPCGLLYAVAAAALVSGSATGGAATLGGFAVGSLPLLALAQGLLPRLRGILGSAGLAWFRRGLLLAAAALLAWRAWRDLQGAACCD